MRYKLAFLLFRLSHLINYLGIALTKKGKLSSNVTDTLSLPGWFIINDCLVELVMLPNGKLGFDWCSWRMPAEWRSKTNELKQQKE